MPNRHFIDAQGTAWTVWDVNPARVERELDIVRAARSGGASGQPRPALRLDGAFAAGWLCFESGLGKRRLAPIPEAWTELSGERLSELCESASVVSPPRARSAGTPSEIAAPA
jgi:hypothetical protein